MITHFTIVAASLRDREVWEVYEAAGEAAKATEDLQPFVEVARAWYAADPNVSALDHDLIHTTVVEPIRDPKRKEHLSRVLFNLRNAEVSIPNARAAIKALRQSRVAEELATALLIPDKDGEDKTLGLIDEYVTLRGEPDGKDEATPWSKDTIRPVMGDPTVRVYPSALGDQMRGGLWPGHHMTVFARPEMGKSAFALNMACLAAHYGARVLYLTNEDTPRDLMFRAVVRFTQWSPGQVSERLDDALDVARDYGAERLIFRDMAPGSLAEVDRLVRRYSPDLLVVDQMRNMASGKGAENMTQRLDAIAQGLRNVGKRHGCAVLSITQAGDSARDKAVLDDGDVDSSNTGVSAGCDVLIGIGATPIMVQAGERRLSVIKNKLGGWHGYIDLKFDPITLAYRNI